jgi:hypothetical protein
MLSALNRHIFHQLDAIAERIENVRAAKVSDGRVFARGEALALALRDDFVEIVHGESRVCTSGGVKIGIGFDAEMEIHGTRHEPDAVAAGQRGRLLLLGEAEDADVKRARGFFAAGGNRDLHVIEAKDGHFVFQKEAGRRLPRVRRRNSCRASLRRETSGLRAGTKR